MVAEDNRIPVLMVPGVITPARISFGQLIAQLGPGASAVPKELEVYSADAPPPDYELGMEVEGIGRAADESGFDTFHLVGFSGGGASSLAFTASYPGRLRSLALIEPAWAGNDGWSTDEVAYWREIDRIMKLPPTRRTEEFAVLNSGSGRMSAPAGPPPDWMAKRPAGVAAMVSAFGRYHLDVERLRSFGRPVYIAVGGLSHPVEPSKAERLAGIFPDVRVETYQERHHMDPPHREEAARFAAALRDLWDRADKVTAHAA